MTYLFKELSKTPPGPSKWNTNAKTVVCQIPGQRYGVSLATQNIIGKLMGNTGTTEVLEANAWIDEHTDERLWKMGVNTAFVGNCSTLQIP